MSRETIGFVKLEWTCPNCGQRNPGPQKVCTGCGSPQPENVKFEEAAQDVLITDQAEIEKAKLGPDIHCAFCGARNSAGTLICTQCGADLKEGKQHASGDVVGAMRTDQLPAEPVSCPNCGTVNPGSRITCQQCGGVLKSASGSQPVNTLPTAPKSRGISTAVLIGIGIAVLLCVVGLLLVFRTTKTIGTVQSVKWSRSIAVEEFGPIAREDWRTDIPTNANIGSCEKREYRIQDKPAPDAEKICGTPYKVDKGSGFAEVVQDCKYRIKADYCSYKIDDWKEINPIKLEGKDYSPRWPQLSLAKNQRAGKQYEDYTINFIASNNQYTFTTNDASLFLKCTPGSRWILSVNGLGSVGDIKPE